MKISIPKIKFICKVFFLQFFLAMLFGILFPLFKQSLHLGAFLFFFGAVSAIVSYYFFRPFFDLMQACNDFSEKGSVQKIETEPAQKELRSLIEMFNTLSHLAKESQEKCREEKKEKEAILESLEEGVIAVDGEMKITYANAVGSKMLGISKRHLVDRPFPFIIGKDSSGILTKCHELLKNCQLHDCILTDSLSLKEKKKLYLDLIAVPKEKGKGAIVILQNKSSNFKVLEMGKDFVANASHELRTPITIIKGFAETLQDLPELSPEMLSDITEKIVRNCERMDKLVKNLLTLADIENLPESRFQDCDLVSIVENCRHVLLSVYGDCSVDIRKNKEHITISADPDILELAISNLLDNAAKYSPAPAKITVDLEQLEEEVKIVITDKGIGIPQADLEHIFERFYTVNKARSRRLGGAGLGLSLVKTIIEKHEGIINVKSTLGQGTSFTNFLPLKRPKK